MIAQSRTIVTGVLLSLFGHMPQTVARGSHKGVFFRFSVEAFELVGFVAVAGVMLLAVKMQTPPLPLFIVLAALMMFAFGLMFANFHIACKGAAGPYRRHRFVEGSKARPRHCEISGGTGPCIGPLWGWGRPDPKLPAHF